MSEEQIVDAVRAGLSPERFKHVQGVVETATHLAVRHGVDVGKARLAAWLHDYAREWPVERLWSYAQTLGLPADMMAIPELLHGPVAAQEAYVRFQIQDEEIRNALFYHTTGRVGMSQLECILCLADAIEPSRSYPRVEHLRELAERNLTQALAESFDSTIQYLLLRHAPIYPGTVAARNELWHRVQAAEAGNLDSQGSTNL
ncbi:bis(5'-nucleosyl)-tetraphosphatase (symmetrical) YqeK [Alicyclobacillus herbarius]|uniref:bis(5'-nucleosyl)-tetraphosphatase (symmetrical) YqeK n=1 Tax=Alicyclobacillus herbarius TaxID=122960 RepID=UPI0004293DBF|nr:bis(5'-nucleosyl)-tetraphosphatase (symmetrical) YqeK [Alicyclobacillus herbarius]